MSGKKIFRENGHMSTATDSRQKFSLRRWNIFIPIVFIALFLNNWNRGLPAPAALTASANSFAVPPLSSKAQVNDFDGDGETDFAVVRKESGQLVWYILQSSDQSPSYRWFGLADDKIVSGDYDGDKLTDVAVYRDGQWYVQKSSDGTLLEAQLGRREDLPAQADYDGDGKTDFAVYQPYRKTWVVLRSLDEQRSTYEFNCSDCAEVNSGYYAPAPADYDNDGKADPALIQNNSSASSRKLIIKRSSHSLQALPSVLNLHLPNSQFGAQELGDGKDPDIPRHFNRDGRIDLAIVHQSSGILNWIIFLNIGEQQGESVSPDHIIHWGQCKDYPVAGDYHNNGFTDLAVWRPDDGNFYVRPTVDDNLGSGQMTTYRWGLPQDVPTVPDGRFSCLPAD